MDNEWIDIETRLPPQDTYLLVARWDDRPKVQMYAIIIAKRIGKEWYDDKNEDRLKHKYGYVRFWMTLPDEPK